MRQGLVISFIAEDRPGVIEALSKIIDDHSGNWLESRLSQLAGKFAGIIRVSVDTEKTAALQSELLKYSNDSFTIIIESADQPHALPAKINHLTIFGLDRPGIVREVSTALASKNMNVVEMNSDISSAPMTGEPLFHADVKFIALADESLEDIENQLDAIAAQLSLDISLENTDL